MLYIVCVYVYVFQFFFFTMEYLYLYTIDMYSLYIVNLVIDFIQFDVPVWIYI